MKQADICLVMEGSYPYVSGGVSTCTHQLIEELSDKSFGIVFIGTEDSVRRGAKYRLPLNVKYLEHIFIFKESPKENIRPARLQNSDILGLTMLNSMLHHLNSGHIHLARQGLLEMDQAMAGTRGWNRILSNNFNKSIWRFINNAYLDFCADTPFSDFVYQWQNMHLPIFRLLASPSPQAEVFHSMCTGYAALFAAVSAIRRKAKFLLTEHGLYDQERSLDIAQASWLDYQDLLDNKDESLKRWWLNLFRNLSRIAYHYADQITTLHERNLIYQLQNGAAAEKCEIIPNGLDEKLASLRWFRPPWDPAHNKPFRIGFIGRLVQIKDIKTLLVAAKHVNNRLPSAEFWIVGPADEEPEYAEQCYQLAESLNINVKFTGRRDITGVLPEIDCLVLTSVSESQPLVILEAGTAGIPVIATDVGACRELIEGRSQPDKALGAGGFICPIGDHEAIAAKIIQLALDPELWKRMARSSMKRMSQFYDQGYLLQRYRSSYLSLQRDGSINKVG